MNWPSDLLAKCIDFSISSVVLCLVLASSASLACVWPMLVRGIHYVSARSVRGHAGVDDLADLGVADEGEGMSGSMGSTSEEMV